MVVAAWQGQRKGQFKSHARLSHGSPTTELIRLGQLLSAKNERAESEAILKQAVQSAPAKPQVWLALCSFYARTNQTDGIREHCNGWLTATR